MKGISNQTRLSLRGGEWKDAERELMRWGNGLPFTTIETHLFRSTTQVVTTGTPTAAIFDTALKDTAGVFGSTLPAGGVTSINIPADGGGLYIIQGRGIYFKGTQVPTLKLYIWMLDTKGIEHYISQQHFGYAASDAFGTANITAIRYLVPKDIIQMRYLHGSGVNETLGTNGGGNEFPTLHIARLTL